MCVFSTILLDGTSNGSDSKKLRVEDRVGDAPPSRVLHIRKLPNEVSETEVIALGLPFGKVTNILTLKGKNQVSGCVCIYLLVCLLLFKYPTKDILFFFFLIGIPGAKYRGSGHYHGKLLLSCYATCSKRTCLHTVFQSQRAQD